MQNKHSKEIRSTVTSDGNVEISIAKVDIPTPADDEVLIEIYAAPINPSDLALLTTFGGDVSNIKVSGSGDNTSCIDECPSCSNEVNEISSRSINACWK